MFQGAGSRGREERGVLSMPLAGPLPTGPGCAGLLVHLPRANGIETVAPAHLYTELLTPSCYRDRVSLLPELAKVDPIFNASSALL
jgi:hypothetical protein